MVESTLIEMKKVFEAQLENQFNIKKTTAEERVAKLTKLSAAISSRAADIVEAANADYIRPETEENNQIQSILHAIQYVSENLSQWMKPEEVGSPAGSKSKIIYEPKGVVCVIGTWNSPLATSIHPLVEAVAAGNCVILKPSEVVSAYSQVLKEIIEEVFEENEVAVAIGDANVATELLKLPFHHFFYTGSPQIGKIVMEAAAKNLASVTLELGGKSPVIIDRGANLQQAAQNLVFGKIMMGGQICISPDYIFVHQDDLEQFTAMYNMMTKAMLYDENGVIRQTERTTIVNEKHFARLKGLYEDAQSKGATILSGGHLNEELRLIEPTLFGEISEDMRIQEEEIFGPLTFVQTYDNIEDVFHYINSRQKPLALYIFSEDEAFQEAVLANTSSGGVTINGILMHNTNYELPFGGVNNSGIGNFHGVHGFRALSHARSVYTVLSE